MRKLLLPIVVFIVISCSQHELRSCSGQPCSVDFCLIAIYTMIKVIITQNNIVSASFAFFPFLDCIEKLVQSGVSAVIQPSGSISDKEIIKFANDTNTILVFSKTRHFRH